MVDEELASGIAPDDISEKDNLIEELMEKEESFLSLSTKKTSDRATAEEMRKQAMERMGDTAKRRNDAKGDGNLKEIKKRRTGGEIVAYSKERAKAEQAIRQEENEINAKNKKLQWNDKIQFWKSWRSRLIKRKNPNSKCYSSSNWWIKPSFLLWKNL